MQWKELLILQCAMESVQGNFVCNQQLFNAVANGLKECADAADTRHRPYLVNVMQHLVTLAILNTLFYSTQEKNCEILTQHKTPPILG